MNDYKTQQHGSILLMLNTYTNQTRAYTARRHLYSSKVSETILVLEGRIGVNFGGW